MSSYFGAVFQIRKFLLKWLTNLQGNYKAGPVSDWHQVARSSSLLVLLATHRSSKAIRVVTYQTHTCEGTKLKWFPYSSSRGVQVIFTQKRESGGPKILFLIYLITYVYYYVYIQIEIGNIYNPEPAVPFPDFGQVPRSPCHSIWVKLGVGFATGDRTYLLFQNKQVNKHRG